MKRRNNWGLLLLLGTAAAWLAAGGGAGAPWGRLIPGIAALLLAGGFFFRKRSSLPMALGGGMLLVWLDASVGLQGLLVLGGALLFLGALALLRRKKGASLTPEDMLLGVAFLAMALHLAYILATPYSLRSNDVSFLGAGEGHLAYMEYLLDHGFRLPDFDPTTVWQFYHPPLHHYLGAFFLKLSLLLGIPLEQGAEQLQFLPLLYSGFLLLFSRRFFRLMGLGGRGLLLAFSLTALHPVWILLSGNLNNDLLSLTLSLGALTQALAWYRGRKTGDLLLSGLFLGLSMAAKASGALLIPALGFLLAWAFFREWGKKPWKLLPAYGGFLLISVPIGTAWALYNNIRWGMPLSYVAPQSLASPEYLGGYSLLERFLPLDPGLFTSPFRILGDPAQDYSVPLGLLKTALFGEGAFFPPGSLAFWASAALFWLQALLALTAFLALVRFLLFKRKGVPGSFRATAGIVAATLMGSFLSFNIQYPFMSTYHFRYVALTLILGALGLGYLLEDLRQGGRRRGGSFLEGAVLAFLLLTLLVYGRLLMVS